MTENEILSYFANEGPTEEQQQEADEFQPVYFFATDDRPNVALCSRCDQLMDATGHGHLERPHKLYSSIAAKHNDLSFGEKPH